MLINTESFENKHQSRLDQVLRVISQVVLISLKKQKRPKMRSIFFALILIFLIIQSVFSYAEPEDCK